MERLVKGDIIVIPFPFTNLTTTKKRPALIISKPIGEDLLVTQITGKNNLNKYSIEIDDFETGNLPIKSFAKTNKIFTLNKTLVLKKAGKVKQKKLQEIQEKIISILKE